jgi:hypothetical protein
MMSRTFFGKSQKVGIVVKCQSGCVHVVILLLEECPVEKMLEDSDSGASRSAHQATKRVHLWKERVNSRRTRDKKS